MHRSRVVPVLLILALLASLSLMVVPTGAADHSQQVTIRSTTTADTIARPVAATQTVYITRTGKCYHRDGCSCLKKSKIKTTKTAAVKKGFRACRLCKP